jgi:tricorn protease
MKPLRSLVFAHSIATFLSLAAAARAEPTGIFLDPAASRTHIAFVAARTLYIADRKGGVARPLMRDPIAHTPRFSPDGRSLAYGGLLDGHTDLFVIPVAGGKPHRVTHTPFGKAICEWTPDGRLLFATNPFSFYRAAMQLYTVPARGGLPKQLPVAFGGEGALTPDGRWLAYTPTWQAIRSWKRYAGGMAQRIRLLDLKTGAARRLTAWHGTESRPMWRGDTLYYLSDEGPEHRLNLWRYDMKSRKRRQLTHFQEFDVQSPSMAPGPDGKGEIVFQYAGGIRSLDLARGTTKPIDIVLPVEDRKVGVRLADVGRNIPNADPSPDGAKMAVEARGDIWIAPAGEGAQKNLTHSSGVAERDPAWSPDGRWIACFSDATGEYELTLISADGSATPRTLTKLGRGFRTRAVWSPDSRRIAFTDQANQLLVCSIADGRTTVVDRDRAQQPQYAWSPDSRSIAYTRTGRNRLRALMLRRLDGGSASHSITEGMVDDSSPAFAPDGHTLYFISRRNFQPTFDVQATRYVVANADVLMAMALTADDSLASMATPVRTERGSLAGLEVTATGKPIYLHVGSDGRTSLRLVTPNPSAARDESTVLESVTEFRLSADKSHALVRTGAVVGVVDASPKQTLSRKLDASAMKTEIDLPAEWRQIYLDLWRLYRDYFYDTGMHGQDWKSIREKYRPLLAKCLTREDVNYVLGELVGELSVGHGYIVSRGDVAPFTTVDVGLLGADFEVDRGAYRIRRILRGAPWDPEGAGPLSQPGVRVSEGDYLLAVDGRPITVDKDPWSAFDGAAGRQVNLTVSSRPVIDAQAREVVVTPIGSESALREADWTERNRREVARQTGGKVGYIHVPDYNSRGAASFERQFRAQIDRQALIVDARFGQGGFLGDAFFEVLSRRPLNYVGGRYGPVEPNPKMQVLGPKCLLINGMTISAGENFASYFKIGGIGPVIGSRTWGGLVGLNGNPALIDGGYWNIPDAPFFRGNGRWMVEGWGVEPDVPVDDSPESMARGKDLQLQTAIRAMQKALAKNPGRLPSLPPHRNRTGIGVPTNER